VFTHSIEWFEDDNKILNLRLVDYHDNGNALAACTTYFSAREKLETWIDEYQLCLRYCGLTDDESICFNHQIKKCNGICADMEEAKVYNKRVRELLRKHTFAKPNFVIIDKGKSPNQQSVLLIEKNKYIGYGYIDSSTQIASSDEFKSIINPAPYHPDSTDLIKSWLKKNNAKVIHL